MIFDTRAKKEDAPDSKTLAAEHTREAIGRRLDEGLRPDYLPDFVYGAIDGTVTTFAVVSGVAGASLSPSIVIVLGLANLVGDGFSMAASNFSGTRVERQQFEKMRAREEHEIDTYPSGEREEIRQIMNRKGFEGDDLERAVTIITQDKERWVRVMLTDELGLSLSAKSPLVAAATTFVAFLILGFLPLFPFVFAAITGGVGDTLDHGTYLQSTILTAAAFFLVGAVKSRFIAQSWLFSGLETLALGGSAAAIAYFIGKAISNWV
ncbi:VIT1/CCC1 transporter family protein [Rhodopirellula bahusiensis]|uniref:Iron transporter n=1 Tax=Rhodopirellula bahusiensis TaxID=2014065 RepID=A0A2G1W4E4_9BACT|nr:VIT1/CCC1 transporter family protein [Rhodopirellula bahusiensis]PHQ33892.1 hypothetical protein CEE69_18475 [Rhodopirellula bahusiensis]